ncbi:MAG: CZB domain-containing protein [Zoogloea sp.]|uniref:CZB domain-containing protein n=1 Tax=Zoogloea sp. TaxID=49181 RepID=UPI003F40B003|nr:CZB domain-containing protein [Rhodocyclales bacterium]
MAFLNWLRRPGEQEDAADLGISLEDDEQDSTPEAASAGARRPSANKAPAGPDDYDAVAAIEAHIRWKAKLESRLFGTNSRPLVADQVFRDNRCPLGRWIYARGSLRFGTSNTYADLKRYNAEFHRYAGQAVLAFNSGQREEAIHMVTTGEYTRASTRVQQTLARLFAEAEQRQRH